MNIPGIQRHDHLQPSRISQEALEQMQHDIRNPLGTILGLSDILSSMAATPDQQKMADILKSSSQSLKFQMELLFDTLHRRGAPDKK